MISNMISRLFVDPTIDLKKAEPIAKRLNLPLQKATKEELIKQVKSMTREEKFLWGKATLFLTQQKGNFLKKCPGSTGVLCCNYYVINTVSGCPFDCSYCILQNYIENNPFITFFINREDMIWEIKQHLASHRHLRVGTGELTDSLALDAVLEESRFFLEMISLQQWTKRITIEFKTKSAEISPLLQAYQEYPNVDVVVGFSVNLPEFTLSDEHNTAPFEKRLDAMQTLQKNKIPLAIHFDPIIMGEGLLKPYQTLAKHILSSLDLRLIRWISMGGYRHTISLAPLIENRFPKSLLLSGEMFASDIDHKFRYFHPIRREFYQGITNAIRSVFPEAPIYLCMEKPFLWEESKLSLPMCRECFSS